MLLCDPFSIIQMLLQSLPYLYTRPIEDSRVWKATTDGSYTIKSAYRICIDLIHEYETLEPHIGSSRIGSSFGTSKSHLTFAFSSGKERTNAFQRELTFQTAPSPILNHMSYVIS